MKLHRVLSAIGRSALRQTAGIRGVGRVSDDAAAQALPDMAATEAKAKELGFALVFAGSDYGRSSRSGEAVSLPPSAAVSVPTVDEHTATEDGGSDLAAMRRLSEKVFGPGLGSVRTKIIMKTEDPDIAMLAIEAQGKAKRR